MEVGRVDAKERKREKELLHNRKKTEKYSDND